MVKLSWSSMSFRIGDSGRTRNARVGKQLLMRRDVACSCDDYRHYQKLAPSIFRRVYQNRNLRDRWHAPTQNLAKQSAPALVLSPHSLTSLGKTVHITPIIKARKKSRVTKRPILAHRPLRRTEQSPPSRSSSASSPSTAPYPRPPSHRHHEAPSRGDTSSAPC